MIVVPTVNENSDANASEWQFEYPAIDTRIGYTEADHAGHLGPHPLYLAFVNLGVPAQTEFEVGP